MPTVRITKRIKQGILIKAGEVATNQRENLPEATSELGIKIVEFLIDKYDLPIKGHKDLVKEINTIHFVDLAYLIENPSEVDNGYELEIVLTSKIKTILPHILATAPDRIWIGPELDIQFSDDINQELKTLVNQRLDIEKQADVFMQTIKDLLSRCTTLKQFIEAWPQGEQFVPQSALQQHYEQEKKQRKRGIYLNDETLTDLNSILLTSKII
ncbi:MAG: hypothetical protein DRQ01_00870 [Ignavibacteriae bacterium]|nr:MAG: hypothetical protein DRQ01_00870 [Ignavibacteriota bacterium]